MRGSWVANVSVMCSVLLLAGCYRASYVNVENLSAEAVVVQMTRGQVHEFWRIDPGRSLTVACIGGHMCPPGTPLVQIRTSSCPAQLLFEVNVTDDAETPTGVYRVTDGPTVGFESARPERIEDTDARRGYMLATAPCE